MTAENLPLVLAAVMDGRLRCVSSLTLGGAQFAHHFKKCYEESMALYNKPEQFKDCGSSESLPNGDDTQRY